MMPDRSLGRFTDSTIGACTGLRKQDIRTVQFESMADLLRRSTLWMPLRNGGFGQYDAISMLGASPAQMRVSLDGRPMEDLWSGQFHIAQTPVGSLERIEFLYGTDAIGLSAQPSSTLINMQSVIYNSSAPYMSMWYHQGAGDLVAANVVFAQNIARGLNVSVNVRRAGARGRYQRTDYDQWNLDLQTRWSIDARQSLLVRYGLSTLNSQIWGGLDTSAAASTFEETTPVSLSEDRTLQDESRRHDLTATYQRHLSDDSTSVLSGQAYVSGQSMHRNLGSALFVLTGDTSGVGSVGGTHSGFVIRLDEKHGALRLRAGSHVALRNIDSSSLTRRFTSVQPEFFAHADYAFSTAIHLRSALRAHSVSEGLALSYGLGASVLSGSAIVKADVSMFQQSPSAIQERFAVLSERHVLTVIEAATTVGGFEAGFVGFYRQIDDAIELGKEGSSASQSFLNSGRRSVMGLLLRGQGRMAGIDVTPRIRYQHSALDAAAASATMLLFDCSLSYEYRTTSNSIRFGVMASWMPASVLPGYEPLFWTFRQGAGRSAAQFDGTSAFMTAVVGNASLRLSYENIFGSRWTTVLNAPELTRVFRFSVDWSFAD